MDNNSHSVRVLVRPPPAPVLAAPATNPIVPAPRCQNGIIVVGFIGKRTYDIAHLINKIIDSNVFGSGNLDTRFNFEEPELVKWFESRKLSYYRDEEKGILYLQFCMDSCLVNTIDVRQPSLVSRSVLEDQEFGDLQGMLFMFSVCHIVMLIQEGSKFDTQMLKKFRVLQAAKNTASSSIRSQNLAPITAKPRYSASPWMSSTTSANSSSPGKSRGRNGSTVTIMSGLGSHTSLLPGQCIPVILFVFLDDFMEIHHAGNLEDPPETSINSSTSLNSMARSGLSMKGSGSLVVLGRPAVKSDGGLRKKLQSSLEAQIRFSIKKCRTLTGGESSHAASRNAVISNSPPLFSLDASKAVSLVHVCSCQSGESLEFAISLVEEVLDGKATPDSLLLENHQKSTKKEDVLSLKEFIDKQSDILRGRSGLGSTNNSGSVAGVGMVAVAAAAAAASVSPGKISTAPELPTLEIWSSTCQLILLGILSAKQLSASETREQTAGSPPRENITSACPLKSVGVSHLENGTGINTRFSTLWCEKAFPIAREVYLDELPPCYPSSQHDDHLEKALHVLTSMVKGPAVRPYLKKLKDECTSIWCSGRQQCDAISLNGKPCIHQRHDINTPSEDEIKPHSSGLVYLHACACGRSRKLRPDPFDYETANVASKVFECDKLLPVVHFSQIPTKGPVQPSSWSLMRIGCASYYDPSKGLIQSGFAPKQRFLLRWTVFEKRNEIDQLFIDRNTNLDTVVDADKKISHLVQLKGNESESNVRTFSDITQIGSKNMISDGGISNLKLRKPFSEVVAGPAAASTAFPPLSYKKLLLPDTDKGAKLHQGIQWSQEKSGGIRYFQESPKVESIASIGKVSADNGIAGEKCFSGNPVLHIGRVPLNMNGSEQNKAAHIMKHSTIYVGFEHECPHGHRFILTSAHLSELCSLDTMPEENTFPLSVENSNKKQDPSKLGKYGGYGRPRRQSNGITMVVGSGKSKSLEKLEEKVPYGSVHSSKSMQSIGQGKDQNDISQVSSSVNHLDYDLKATTNDSGDHVFSLLNRRLPIYMNCPHCRESMTKNETSNFKFASTISQLQRIFVVTPSYPILLAADPIVQFEVSYLPSSVPDREQKLQFRLGCPAVLPPDSFLCLRLPFVYGVQLDDGSLHSLKPFENQPELSAWILEGTSLQVVSDTSNLDMD